MTDRIKRKERITEERTRQILDAAFKVFSSKGLDKATIADIAHEAEIGVGTIYNYYKDKHALWISLISDMLLSERFAQMLNKIVEPRSPENDEEFMQLILEDRLGFAFGNAQKFMFLFLELQRNPKLRKQYNTQIIQPILTVLENYIQFQIQQGNFRKVDKRIVARTLFASIIGNAMIYKLESKSSPYKKSNIRDVARELSSLYSRGLDNR